MRLLFQEANSTGWIFSGHFWELLPFKLMFSLSEVHSRSGTPLRELGTWGALFPHQFRCLHLPTRVTDTACCTDAVSLLTCPSCSQSRSLPPSHATAPRPPCPHSGADSMESLVFSERLTTCPCRRTLCVWRSRSVCLGWEVWAQRSERSGP